MSLVDDLQSYASGLENTFGLPTGFLQGQIAAESSWNPNAQNGNASGIAQFMPGTANDYGVDTSDPYSSLLGAAEYDSDLYGKSGSWEQVLKSYGTTAGNSLNTNKAAQAVNTLAQNADSGNDQSFNPIDAINNMFTPTGMRNVATTNPDGSPTGVFNDITNYIAKEKYNVIAIFVGLGFVVAAGAKLMDGSDKVVELIAAGAELA